MELQELHRELTRKQYDKLYIFTGDDWKVQQIYIQQIAKVSGLDLVYVDGINSIINHIGSKSLIFKSKCYVITDEKSFITEKDAIAKLLERVEKSDDILILKFSNIDKRGTLYKKFGDRVVNFESLPREMLVKYIQKKIHLNNTNANLLADVCENNYGQCLLEIDKMISYAHSDVEVNVDYDIMFTQFIQDGTIHIPPRDAIFEFIDAVMDRNVNKSFKLERECLDGGEAPMVMLSVLYSHMKWTLQVQSCKDKNIERVTGLQKWEINHAKRHLNVWGTGELVYAMKLIAKVIQGIKIGEYSERTAVDYILVNVI